MMRSSYMSSSALLVNGSRRTHLCVPNVKYRLWRPKTLSGMTGLYRCATGTRDGRVPDLADGFLTFPIWAPIVLQSFIHLMMPIFSDCRKDHFRPHKSSSPMRMIGYWTRFAKTGDPTRFQSRSVSVQHVNRRVPIVDTIDAGVRNDLRQRSFLFHVLE